MSMSLRSVQLRDISSDTVDLCAALRAESGERERERRYSSTCSYS
jgi:hypothetical protein